MGLKTLVRAIKREGSQSLRLSLAENWAGPLATVTFEVSTEGNSYHEPISTPFNQGYVLTGMERTKYGELWSSLSATMPPNPLRYLGPGLEQAYERNLPNAFHLISGWLRKFHDLEMEQRILGMKAEYVGLGTHPFEREILVRLEEGIPLYFYQGNITGDARIT